MSAARAPVPFVPWAVLPAKRFGRAKTRLDPALDAPARRALARALFERVLSACTDHRDLEGTLVATDGEDVAELAARRGAAVLRDAGPASGPLARVVDGALADLRARGATHALVIMADLPRIEARDVRELLGTLRDADVVLVPDALRRGTSALGVRLDLGFRTAFGRADSLARHLREAEQCRAVTRVVYNPRVAPDIDTPRDLAGHL
jgi:2-phospho-L-lactate/phosphoenolpyruvate guanylyltransferase